VQNETSGIPIPILGSALGNFPQQAQRIDKGISNLARIPPPAGHGSFNMRVSPYMPNRRLVVAIQKTFEIMTYAKLKRALGVALRILLAGSVAMVVLSCRKADGNLPASEVFKKAQEKYAALTSYSDEGKTVAILNGMTLTTTFTIRLARPNFYRIEWEQNNDSAFSTSKTKPQAVWSAGEGDFLEMAGKGAQKQASQEMALGGATGISGGAAATVPGTFFKMNWGNQHGSSGAGEKRQADEKVGKVDCYVFASELKGAAKTLWIGKQDFLIHQVRTVTSTEAMKAMMDEAAKRNPGMVPPPQKFDGLTSTETHTSIVLNNKFLPTDFAR
jgi:hypothetical protein